MIFDKKEISKNPQNYTPAKKTNKKQNKTKKKLKASTHKRVEFFVNQRSVWIEPQQLFCNRQ